MEEYPISPLPLGLTLKMRVGIPASVNDIKKVGHYLTLRQKRGESVSWQEMAKDLSSVKVLGIDVLRTFMENPLFIPVEWAGGVTFFWGDVYADEGGILFIGCLEGRGVCLASSGKLEGAWRSSFVRLDRGLFCRRNPAAVILD